MPGVLDTNVIVSGLYSKRGASFRILKEALSGELSFAISPLVALEYEGKILEKIENRANSGESPLCVSEEISGKISENRENYGKQPVQTFLF